MHRILDAKKLLIWQIKTRNGSLVKTKFVTKDLGVDKMADQMNPISIGIYPFKLKKYCRSKIIQ